MNDTNKLDVNWTKTQGALKSFINVLSCGKCKNIPSAPIRYTNCGHFFCTSCPSSESKCYICHTPVRPNEIRPDHTVANLIRYCDAVSEIIGLPPVHKDNGKPSTPPRKHEVVTNTVRKKSNGIVKSIPKNLNKRNAKGETPLHTACVKGNLQYLKCLLDAGANPNTKDNADWTPLQEAISLGFYEISELLLLAGAIPNTPGINNKTALHEAAFNNRCEEAKLLLRYHANKNVYDQYGKIPLDYCSSEEMRIILTEGSTPLKSPENASDLDCTLNQSIFFPDSKIVLASNLKNDSRELLSRLASRHKVKVVSKFRPSVTHVIVEANDQNITKLTFDVLLTILYGKWLLNTDWIRLSLELDELPEQDFELFEVIGVTGTPSDFVVTRARQSAEKQNPRLFNGCYFYFALSSKNTYNIGGLQLTKDNLTTLVNAGDGTVLTREPNPEDINDTCQLVPFHVANDLNHPLHNCSHYIIYAPGKEEPRIKYNMPHVKSLPLVWFIECIEKFKLLDPALLGLT